MMEGLKIPEGDKTVRLVVHEPHRFPHDSERYTLVDVDLFSVRSFGAKKALYQAIVRNLEPFAIPPDQVDLPTPGFRLGGRNDDYTPLRDADTPYRHAREGGHPGVWRGTRPSNSVAIDESAGRVLS